MSYELFEIERLFEGIFEFAVLISFFYLYFIFRSKWKSTGVKVYSLLSSGFGFSVLSMLIPMVAIFIGSLLVGDDFVDQLFIFNDIPYYLTTTLSIMFFVLAAKKIELKKI
ncbi:hypothetical protein [Colwellia sp. MB02u-14]|uniref:hypothetical protein n=1 Tax=Colwellia sp. MB02u-14 TaxID=2759815 RepID=UPI0015F3AAC7|nr:hypothetical protein [Colwellia sp. MB02u-14]MBA6302342.1 hypothetical protein [Colwellia sp. MB02u-14]